jgi:hypothetical protein
MIPTVAPPSDWGSILVVATIGLVLVAVGAYIVWLRRTPGRQLGEEFVERVADRVYQRLKGDTGVPAPLEYDGIHFDSDAKLEEYKAAKAIVESHKRKE